MDSVQNPPRYHYVGDSPSLVGSYAVLVVVGAAATFHCVNLATTLVPVPEKMAKAQDKWRNIATSFVHAMIVGTWSLLCLYRNPEMIEDLIHRYNILGEVLVAVAVGYFLHDLIDVIGLKKIKDVWPLLLHHIIVISCFSIALGTKNFIYYAVVALFCEVNSIFLHGRQLLQMCDVSRNSALYRLISSINIVTFAIFRFGTLLWMTWWVAMNHREISLVLVAIAILGLIVMMSVNVVLFVRLLNSDFLKRQDPTKKDILDK
ncbi:TLC domain-containing protein 2-like [Glandiceps talaboti]